MEKDSAEIVFSSADSQDWPDIPPDETVHSRYLQIWEGSSCSLTCCRDYGREDVDNAANLFYSDDCIDEYWLWKTSEAPED